MKTIITTANCYKKYNLVCQHDNGELISSTQLYFRDDDAQKFIEKCRKIDEKKKEDCKTGRYEWVKKAGEDDKF